MVEVRALLSVFMVSSTADSGAGSLRQAILDANAHTGADTIDFDIGAGGLQTITPLSALPQITDPVTVDGTSQPGYAGNPIIELDGASAGSSANGLWITGGHSAVEGLVINRFAGAGVRLELGGSDLLENDRIGTDPTGTIAEGNHGDGVFVFESGTTIGGTSAATGNVISGNAGEGIRIAGAGSTANTVIGNLIGTNAAGTGALGNGFDGVFLNDAPHNRVGGLTLAERNVISGNGAVGIRIAGATATGNLILGNAIGTQADGTSPLGNVSDGVFINAGASSNIVGGLVAGAGNIIAFNAGSGVAVVQATGNAILSNAVYRNAFLGIDIGSDGLTTTNLPTLTSAIRVGTSSLIQGTIQGAPNTVLVLQFFANGEPGPAGYGEGQTLLGTAGVTTDQAGNASYRFRVSGVLANRAWITANATDPAHTTWEFSQGVFYQSGTAYDFDGDGQADPAVFRFSTDLWQIQGSQSGLKTALFGQPGVDTPIAADWDVDGKTDKAVFRAQFGAWLISGSRAGPYGFQFGTAGDIPVQADFDGDGKIDAAVFRPATGTWYVQGSRAGGFTFHLGQAGDIPVPADYEGKGQADFAVYRPSNGTWYIQESDGLHQVQFGQAGVDLPVAADYDGDGHADLAVYRPTTGDWFIKGSQSGGRMVSFGIKNLDLAVPADYDGDGKVDIAVYRPSTSEWLILPSNGGAMRTVRLGTPGLDLPVNLPLAYRLEKGLLPFTSPPSSSAAASPTVRTASASLWTAIPDGPDQVKRRGAAQ